jgi:hypothetical protein
VRTARINNESVYVSVSMSKGYAGPGTYDSRLNHSLSGYAAQDVDNAAGIETTIFSSGIHGETLLTVGPDGSGSLDLTDWGSGEVHGATGAGGVRINARIDWRCDR